MGLAFVFECQSWPQFGFTDASLDGDQIGDGHTLKRRNLERNSSETI
jgi:hypothetical protein